jgi:hypothetical protein
MFPDPSPSAVNSTFPDRESARPLEWHADVVQIAPAPDITDAVGAEDRFRDAVRYKERGHALVRLHPLTGDVHLVAGQRVEGAEGLVKKQRQAAAAVPGR